jgi:anhydro-N-acetylmuramic acid kinase
LLPITGTVAGFDCGPGNVLIDQWCQLKRGLPFDAGGAWASQGKVQDQLLAQALADPFYALPPPKSTGRDLFDDTWVQRWLAASGDANYTDADVAATLTELTAQTVTLALRKHMPRVQRVVVCGGGAYNTLLLERLGVLVSALAGPGLQVHSSAQTGIAPEQVEALAFAWLARAFLTRKPGNLPRVTGARGMRVLGALYPAG